VTSQEALGLERDAAFDRPVTWTRLKVRPPVSTVPGPDEITALHELRAAIDRTLGSLTPREALVVRRYYGFEGDGCTYDELGEQLGISGGRIHQIIAKALRKLRHPSRRKILRPYVDLDQKIEAANKEAARAQMIEAIRDAEEQRAREEEQRAREALRRRIGDEIGSPDSGTRWSDDRRQAIAVALDDVRSEVVTEVRSSDEVYAYLRKHLGSCWRVYEAWKRDVRRRIPDNNVTFTRGIMADGTYLISARRDQRTWYLFDADYGLSRGEFRWVGYVEAVDTSARRGSAAQLDREIAQALQTQR
jgi:DNA-binding CsgD family transcriptional regulator